MKINMNIEPTLALLSSDISFCEKQQEQNTLVWDTFSWYSVTCSRKQPDWRDMRKISLRQCEWLDQCFVRRKWQCYVQTWVTWHFCVEEFYFHSIQCLWRLPLFCVVFTRFLSNAVLTEWFRTSVFPSDNMHKEKFSLNYWGWTPSLFLFALKYQNKPLLSEVVGLSLRKKFYLSEEQDNLDQILILST